MSGLPLEGKSILFFCPKTFGYEKEITRKLEHLGATVTFKSILPTEHPWFKAVSRLMPRVGWLYGDYYFKKWLLNQAPASCDFIFVVKGDGLSPKILALLKNTYRNAKMVLHLWDSLSNCRLIEKKLQYFDTMSSFDPVDCASNTNFKYRPLFFLDKYLMQTAQELTPRIFFLGTLNGDRPKIIRRVAEKLDPEVVFDYWLFIRNKLEISLRKLVDLDLRSFDTVRFLSKPMGIEEITQHFRDCSAVLDIEHPNQTGLTMRTLEVLAAGKKLITTNKQITKHEFFDSTRILVIDRENPVITFDFMESSLVPLPANFFIKYSLESWLKDVLAF